MIDYNLKEIKNSQNNEVILKNINLDYKLDFFLLIDSNDKDYIKVLEEKIIDLVIEKITKKDTYKDFSVVLEKINHILRIYNKENNNYLNILIAISNDKDFIFSQVWESSLYLIKQQWETIEITDKKTKTKEFNYISEWYLEHNDILVASTTRLLNYLSYSDFIDTAKTNNIEKINNNIASILKEENIWKNIWVIVIKYKDNNYKNIEKSKFKQNLEKVYFKIIDNNFVKLVIAYFKIIQEKLEKKSKLIKNIIILTALIVTSFIFFFILNWIIQTASNNSKIINYKELLEDAKKYKTIASNNYNNPEQFNFYVNKTQEIINKLKKEKLFLNNVNLLQQDLNSIKKAFNQIETFKENPKNLVYQIPTELKNKTIKNLNILWKDYIITKKDVIWPILKDSKVKINNFDKLWDDEFIDATPLKNSIILLTKKWKIVEYKWGYFSFKDVKNQDTWEKADSILSYGQNLYLIDKNNAQIFKHPIYGKWFNAAVAYLKPEDQKYIWKIESIAIDWWFYILKWDLEVLKFFSNPYRLEKITLKKLPKTYKKENNENPKIIARKDLNYVYMLLNNKIWIFKPNTQFYKQTKSLTYLWQIESMNNKIIDFSIEKDSIIKVLLQNWLYKISFNENDGKILVNN